MRLSDARLRRVVRFCGLAAALSSSSIAQGEDQNGKSTANGLYLGADLSYVNEMEDCGAIYRAHGKAIDPFAYLRKRGGNIVRVRLWNDANWTRYSGLDDVVRTLARARAAGLKTLLDFHYSDDWADGDKQMPPKAWQALAPAEQARALHDFTLLTLRRLDSKGLMPDWVQIGNETNGQLLGGATGPVNWTVNAALLNAGISAVREAGQKGRSVPRIMLHVAQPENILRWFDAAQAAGVRNYELIGISYYKKWSKFSITELGSTISMAKKRYGKEVVLVETAYPFTDESGDNSPNLLGSDSLIAAYRATPSGQRAYLKDLTQTVVDNGGIGVIYWEPDWVSTKCATRWGIGSNWENAAWFDLRKHEALPAFDFLSMTYRPTKPVANSGHPSGRN